MEVGALCRIWKELLPADIAAALPLLRSDTVLSIDDGLRKQQQWGMPLAMADYIIHAEVAMAFSRRSAWARAPPHDSTQSLNHDFIDPEPLDDYIKSCIHSEVLRAMRTLTFKAQQTLHRALNERLQISKDLLLESMSSILIPTFMHPDFWQCRTGGATNNVSVLRMGKCGNIL